MPSTVSTTCDDPGRTSGPVTTEASLADGFAAIWGGLAGRLHPVRATPSATSNDPDRTTVDIGIISSTRDYK
jgi:hypothetical protein